MARKAVVADESVRRALDAPVEHAQYGVMVCTSSSSGVGEHIVSLCPIAPGDIAGDGQKPPAELVEHSLDVHRALPGGLCVGGLYCIHPLSTAYPHGKKLAAKLGVVLANIHYGWEAPRSLVRFSLVCGRNGKEKLTAHEYDGEYRAAGSSVLRMKFAPLASSLRLFTASYSLDKHFIPLDPSQNAASSVRKWISQLSENIQAHSMFRVGGRVFRVGEEVGTVDELASAGTVKQHGDLRMTLVEVLSPFGSAGPAASLSESTTGFVVLQNHIVAVATALGDAVANDLVHALAEDIGRALQSKFELLNDAVEEMYQNSPSGVENPLEAEKDGVTTCSTAMNRSSSLVPQSILDGRRDDGSSLSGAFRRLEHLESPELQILSQRSSRESTSTAGTSATQGTSKAIDESGAASGSGLGWVLGGAALLALFIAVLLALVR